MGNFEEYSIKLQQLRMEFIISGGHPLRHNSSNIKGVKGGPRSSPSSTPSLTVPAPPWMKMPKLPAGDQRRCRAARAVGHAAAGFQVMPAVASVVLPTIEP